MTAQTSKISMVSNNLSTNINLTIIGNGKIVQPTLMLTTDKHNYLFNCTEGTQRMIIEHNRWIKFGKLKYVFFTGTKYENWSGFWGLVLTMADIRNELEYFGPKKFDEIGRMYKQFLQSASKLNLKHVVTNNDQKLMDLINNDDFLIRSISYEHLSCYIIIIKDKIGKLLIEKCKQFNIPPGPKFSSLKNGQTIEIDGKTIRPEDVIGPSEEGSAMIILECPNIDYLNQFYLKLEQFKQYVCDRQIELVLHLTPSNVYAHDDYQKWLKSFDQNIKHIILNENSNHDLSLISSNELQIKLNQIDADIFPLSNELKQQHKSLPIDAIDHETQVIIDKNIPNLFSYQLRPTKKLKILEPNCCGINLEEIQKQVDENEELSIKINEYHEMINLNGSQNGQTHDEYPEILFLGTGSSQPGKQRNTSAILLNFNNSPTKQSSILLDCGESTILQLIRFYGHENYHKIIENIRIIFISHYHADHHFGLVKLLKEKQKSSSSTSKTGDKLSIIAPYSILSFIQNYHENFENLYQNIDFIPCESLLFNKQTKQSRNSEEKKQLLLDNQSILNDIITISVPHCYESYAIYIETANNSKKIIYSGDTMYALQSFEMIGNNCDILIHEATMNDDLEQEAIYKRHSTISQAINIGYKLNARYTILTHFSQRYAKIAPINLIDQQQHNDQNDQDFRQNSSSFNDYIQNNVILAFDFMKITRENIERSTKLKKILESMFDDEIKRIKDVIIKRNNKRKLLAAEEEDI